MVILNNWTKNPSPFSDRYETSKKLSYPFYWIISKEKNNNNNKNIHTHFFFPLKKVASLCENPELLKAENRSIVSKLYPKDAIKRAELLTKNIGSIGAYSHSKGISHIRENVAKFIEERDGYSVDPEHIFLTQGASEGVQRVLQMLTQNEKSGIMIPIPQYPLYSATLSLVDASPVPYYLDESSNWGLSRENLSKSVEQARANGVDVRALVIINPGNPTGQCLSEDNIRDIIDFCHKERIVLLADEVYQTNIYQPEHRPFHSFKKILSSMGPEYQEQELFSFHSTSKGMIGECGRRGGYFECTNIDNAVLDQLYKMASINLCPNVHGQIMVDLMTNPPVKGDESYPQYKAEYDAIYESLGRRAIKLADSFNKLEGVTCNSAEGESCDEREKKELYGLNIAGDDGKEKETKKKEMYIHIY